ncbi:MAG: hypothetical protein IPJ88_03175 [Myxococcales bacterium]|nr:MAG: hypothetical protein IPJ88_03175 [Myxococcales bacterium]
MLWCVSPIATDALCDFAACELSGAVFESVNTYECGLCLLEQDCSCHWSISFTESRLRWSYGDVMEGKDYSCIGGNISTNDNSYSGFYDPRSGILTWDGIEYTRTADPTL